VEGVSVSQLEQLRSDWLLHFEAEGHNPKAVHVYKTASADFIRFLVQHKIAYDQVSMKQLDAWKLSLIQVRKIKPRSVNYYVSALKNWYRWMENEGYVYSSAVLRMKGMKFVKTLPKPMSEADVFKMIDGAKDPQLRAMLEVFYGCGIRHDELRMLNIEDVDLEAGQVRIVAKGMKEQMRPLAGLAIEALKVHIAQLPYRQGPLWICRKFKRRPSQRAICAQIQRLAASLGVSGRIHPHRFRHSFATHLLNRGMGLEQIQTLMGHASIQSTIIYTEVAQEKLRRDFVQVHPRAKPPGV